MQETRVVMEWITPYSTYLLSRFGGHLLEKECPNCKKLFKTNVDRLRCSKECAKQIKKQK